MRDDEVAEWLRRWTANPMGSARVGSNPILVVDFFFSFHGYVSQELGLPDYPKTSPGLGVDQAVGKRFPLPGIEPGPAG